MARDLSFMRVIDELISTQIYPILEVKFNTKMKEKAKLKVKIKDSIIRYSELIIRIFEYYSFFQKGPNTNTNIIIRSSIIRIFE